MPAIKDNFAIVGMGHTEFSRNSGRSEVSMALEAILAAVADAGLEPGDIDGIVGDHPDRVDTMDLASALGLRNMGFFIETDYKGGGVPGGVLHAMAGIRAGRATHVVCVKSLNGASKNTLPSFEVAAKPYENGFIHPFGLVEPEAFAALAARRYLHLFGATGAQFGVLAVACRKHANLNPHAVMYQEKMTLDDYQASEVIADPLRRLDCFTAVDGAGAIVVTTAERARDLKQPPVLVAAAAQACGAGLSRGIKDPGLVQNTTTALAKQLFSMAGAGPSDIDILQIYDDYTPYVIMALEDLGFCKKGEAGGFVEDGNITWPDGKYPLNTSGGNLSEGNLEGFNHILEAVRQLRGTARAQVKSAELALICGDTSTATSGLILRR